MTEATQQRTITLAEYQARTADTQTGSAQTEEYLHPGLVAEAGELLGAQAKMVRDHGGLLTSEAVTMWMKENGDVRWFVAAQVRRIGGEIPETWSDTRYIAGPLEHVARRVLDLAIRYTTTNFDFPWNEMDVLESIWSACNQIDNLLDVTPEQTMLANLDKLAKRKALNCIGGSGDNREEQQP